MGEARLEAGQIEDFRRDGAICIKGAFGAWVAPLREGVAYNEAHPGTFAENADTSGGRFFGDYCNWQRIPQYEDFVRNSPAAAIAAQAMGSKTVRMFHEHVLIKEPGTAKQTPWHQDLPYYNVDGDQTVSIWLALDPVGKETCPQFVAGSHRWGRLFYPRLFTDSSNYDYAGEGFETVPDIDAHQADYEILSWDLAPGDAVLFSFKTLHGAPPNLSSNRRRGFSTRWVGDDATYAVRPGTTSPPWMDIGLAHGDPLDEAHFPVIWRAAG